MNFTYLMGPADVPGRPPSAELDAVRAGELAKAVSQVFRGGRYAVHPRAPGVP